MQRSAQTEQALLRVARTLAAAIDVEEITSEITATALELTGATGAYVERVISPTGLVTVIANAGEGTPPHGTNVPFPGSLTEELINSGEPIMIDTLVSLGKGMAPYLEKACARCAGLVVPLLTEGDVVGTLVLLKSHESMQSGGRRFDERDATTARLLGDLVSVALKRIAREEQAMRDERRSRFLATASIMLSSSLELPTTLNSLANLAIEAIADWCVIDVAASDGSIARVAGAHKDTSRLPLVRALMDGFPPESGSNVPAARTLKAGEPIVLNDLTSESIRSIARNAEHAELVERIGMRSLMSIPLSMGGDHLGVVTFVRDSDAPPFDDNDLLFAQDLATRAALAVSNARHYADAEEARAQAEQDRLALERAVEGKARLIRGFSHDIKNPLGAADGYAQLLLDGLLGELTDKQKESLQRMRSGIATALGLINDVVEFSRAESGQIEVRPSPFNADALVREVVAEHHATAEQAGARVVAGVLAGGQLTCDAIRIRQILGNLVSNAIKYGGSDGEITVSVERDNGEHPRISFSVTDRGQGIPVEKQHLLFEEFTRLHTGKKEGSGLGLAISRRIARVLGGDITVESAAGSGSTFTLWIPAAREQPATRE
jgi:signal transduction histidine kinase